MLIVKEPTEKFNTEEIRRGTLVYAKHKTWENGEKGFVTTASEDEVIRQRSEMSQITFFYGQKRLRKETGKSVIQTIWRR